MNISKKLKTFIIVIGMCSCEHVPTLPTINYNTETQSLSIVQTDIAAHDTAYICISNLYNKVLPVKDTLRFLFPQITKQFDQIPFAYCLATNNNSLSIVVKTSRTSDTIFTYRFETKDMQPIPVAKVVSGDCLGVYDVNFNKDYRDVIRLWIFKEDKTPDSVLIEKMNSLLRQFNYSGYKEYSKVNGNIPIVSSLQNRKYRIDANISGSYFYLYACQSANSIKSFVESKISNGLVDAKRSLNSELLCNHNGESGTNTLFLISIEENWKYTIIPVGFVIIDNIAPTITPIGYRPSDGIRKLMYVDKIRTIKNKSYYDSQSISSQGQLFVEGYNILVNLPTPSTITSNVFISYGSFEGNDYYGYNIPFYIDVSGDVQSITIGNHKLEAKKIKNNECVRLRIKKLHIGDNSLTLSATDYRGNRTTSSLSIPLESIRTSSNYDNEYDDLENRISDLESRIDDLE